MRDALAPKTCTLASLLEAPSIDAGFKTVLV
jgi:hypothetical protein